MTGDRKPKSFYGYVVVAAAFSMQTVAWGIHLTFGVFFNPLLIEFGWTRATISGAASLCMVVLGFVGIIAGRLSDRIGPKTVMIGCGVFLGVGYLLMSQISTIWQLYLFYGAIVAIGLSGMDVVLLSTVTRWFVKKRGMMTGIIKVGTGVGMLVMPLVANRLISGYGWRNSYIIFGIVALVSIVSAAQFLRRDPAQKGLLPYGAEKADAGSLNSMKGGFSLQEAIHTRQFRILCGICVIVYFCAQAIVIHIAPHAMDLGISAASASSILATIGGASMAGRVVLGSASDRVGSRLAMIICLLALVGGLFSLQLAEGLWMLYLFAAIYGFGHGGFFAVISPMVAELFGVSSHGAIFGAVAFSGTIGAAAGPILAGRIFDVTGSYRLAFLISAVASVIALILAPLLRPVKGKEVINESKRST